MELAYIKKVPPEEVFARTSKSAAKIFSLYLNSKEWRTDKWNCGMTGPFVPEQKPRDEMVMDLVALGYNEGLVSQSLREADHKWEKAKALIVRNFNDDYCTQLSKNKSSNAKMINIADEDEDDGLPQRNRDGTGRGRKRSGQENNLTDSGLFKRFHDNFACCICSDVSKQHENLIHCPSGHILCHTCRGQRGDDTCPVCNVEVRDENRCIVAETALKIFSSPEVRDAIEENAILREENKKLSSIVSSLESESDMMDLRRKNKENAAEIKDLRATVAARDAAVEDLTASCNSASQRERQLRVLIAKDKEKTDAKIKHLTERAEEAEKIAESIKSILDGGKKG